MLKMLHVLCWYIYEILEILFQILYVKGLRVVWNFLKESNKIDIKLSSASDDCYLELVVEYINYILLRILGFSFFM